MRYGLSLALLLMFSVPALAAESCDAGWAEWEHFAGAHIQDDGRVIDHNADGISTSEGQSYALFFSLVANDRQRFDHILKWTNDNLAHGDLALYLPGWKWGRADDGEWRLLDMNSAGDADLWTAYALFQAAERWKDSRYRKLAAAMLDNIAKREVVDLPVAGRMLLPASYGFALDAGTWRLNPSYMPIQLLRYFARVDSKGPWQEIALNTARMMAATANGGSVPDWVLYGVDKGFYADAEKGQYTSYDAIRVYLWWAMLDQRDALYGELLPLLKDLTPFAPDYPALPERINVQTGEAEGSAPVGFAAAVAPYRWVLYRYRDPSWPVVDDGAGYYNHVLNMFGHGWMERRFAFRRDGSLVTGLEKCSR